MGWHLSNGAAITYQVDSVNQVDANNKPIQNTWADGSNMVDDKNQPVEVMLAVIAGDMVTFNYRFPIPE